MKVKSGLIKKGYKAVKEEVERREKAQEAKKGRLWRFFLKEDEEDVPIRFLTEEPLCYYEHSINDGGKWTNVACIGEGCELCETKKPSYQAAYLVVDGREFEANEYDAQGQKTGKKKKVKDRIKLLVRGTTVAGQLDRLSRKYGLLDKIWYVTRTGTGTNTVWGFDRGDVDELTEKQMKALMAQLPEELQKLAPDDIVEQQIMAEIDFARGDREDKTSDDEDDKEDIKAKVKSKVQSLKDDDDDDDDEPEDDAEEPIVPKKVVKKAVKKLVKKTK